MKSHKAAWKRLTANSLRAHHSSEDGEICHFVDVMEIYDHEADEAIERLNTLDDVSALAASSADDAQQSESLNDAEVAVTIRPKSCEVDVELEPEEGSRLLSLPSADSSHFTPSLTHPNKEAHGTQRARAPMAKVESFNDPGQIAPDVSQGLTQQHSVKMVSNSEVDSWDDVDNDAGRPTLENAMTSIPAGKHQPQASHAKYNMTAPIDLHYSPVEQQAAFQEVREFLKCKKYNRFVRFFLRAIKSDCEKAVNAMVEILKSFRYNLCDGKFRERFYSASMLHVALLFKRNNICRLLIKAFPGLVSVKYDSEKFNNQTAFHIAASNGQIDILDLMLEVVSKEKGIELLNTQADGTYFTDVHPEGALALTAAAWSGHYKMFGRLVECGADLAAKVHRGNTVLHYIISLSVEHAHSKKPEHLFHEVWDKCAIWWRRWQLSKTASNGTQSDISTFELETKRKMVQVDAFRYLLSIRNDADQNILSLAVNLHSNLTKRILNIENIYKQPQTTFGAMSWSTYDVTEVTSFEPPNGTACRYNPGSVLHIIAHRAKMVTKDEEENYNDLIEEEPIITLVKMKWGTYRFVYIFWCLAHFLMMAGLTAVSLHPDQPRLNILNNTVQVETNLNRTTNATYATASELGLEVTERRIHALYILFVVYPLVYLFLELLDIASTGYSSLKSLDPGVSLTSKVAGHIVKEWSVTGNAPYRICGVCFSAMVISWLLLHFGRSNDQDIPLSLAMVFGWIFMLFFSRACRYVCRFTIMMQKMFFEDCLHFIAVYIFFWLAFSTAMHVLLLYGETPGVQVGNTLYGMLNVVTDAGEKASGEIARIPGIAGALLSLYAVVSVILLLNMLIAMMNTSYEAVKSSKTNIWRNQQLSIMLMIERRLWWWKWLCEKSQRHTWTPSSQLQGKTKEGSGPQRIYLEVTRKCCLESENGEYRISSPRAFVQ